VLWPWNAVALPEIMAWVLQESKRGALGEAGQTGELQASSREVSPEREGVERQKPERGLTLELSRATKWRRLERMVRHLCEQPTACAPERMHSQCQRQRLKIATLTRLLPDL